MIELILEDRCDSCGNCVSTCPTNVFDVGADGKPVIARQDECQSCFLCELYCHEDALYVAPEQYHVELDREAVLASGQVGRYRRDSGWGEWAEDPRYRSEFWRMGGLMGRGFQTTMARFQAHKAEEKKD